MPRRPREEAAGAIHHVVAKGNAGDDIVSDDHDRVTLLGRISRAAELHRWVCLAYCLLDNHFHLVVQTLDPNLGRGMKWLGAGYAQDFNHRHDRRGHLFGGRFYSVVVERDAHLVSAIVYVALNPVRAGLTTRPERWPWNSYGALVGRTAAPPFFDRGRVLDFLGSDPSSAQRALALAVEEALSAERVAWTSRGQTRGV